MADNNSIGPRIVLEGEAEYKKAINDINQSQKLLNSELKLCSSQFDGQANSIEALTKKQEILDKQYEEQEKKVKTFAEALEVAKNKYGENSAQVNAWQIKLNNAQTELNRLDKAVKTNASYMKEAEESTDKTATSIDEYGKKVDNAEEKTLSFGDVLKANLASEAIIEGIKAVGNALDNVGDKVISTVKDTAAYADEILTLSNNTGIATDKLQEYQYMQELTDVSLDTMTSTMAKQIRSMSSAQQGTKVYKDAYKTLKVEIEDVNGKLRDSDDVYWEIIDALGQMENETERDAISMQLFGRSAQSLNSIIKIGSKGVAEFAQEARDMGAVLNDEALTTLGETDDAFQRIDQSLQIFERQMGVAMAPSVLKSIDKVTQHITDMGDELADVAGGALELLSDGLCWIIDNAGTIAAALGGIGAGFATLKAATGISSAIDKMKKLSEVTDIASGTFGKLTSLITGNPALVAAVAIGTLTTAIIAFSASESEADEETRKLYESIEETISSSKELSAEVDELIQSRKEDTKKTETQIGAYKALSDRLYDLADNEKLSNAEKREMKLIVDQLNEAIPALNLSIDETTGALNKQKVETDNLIDSMLRQALVTAAQDDFTEIANKQYESEKKLAELEEQRVAAKELLKKKEDELTTASENFIKAVGNARTTVPQNLTVMRNEYNKASETVDNLNAEIKNQEDTLNECKKEYQDIVKYINAHEEATDNATGANKRFVLSEEQAAEAAEKYTEKMTTAYKKQMDKEESDYSDSLDSKIDALQDYYDEQSDLLSKQQKKAQKELDKAQKEELSALEDKYSKQSKLLEEQTENEISILKQAHNEKLALIDEEYTEKLKVIDEERYLKIKGFQDQIDEIENERAEEKKAAEERKEQEKRAKLENAFLTAETYEERLAAEKELAEFEEDLRLEKIEEERKAAIAILEENIKATKSEYELKEQELKEETTAKRDAATAEYEAKVEEANKRLEERKLELEMEKEQARELLQEKQELQDEALAEQYETLKKELSKRKDTEISSEKEKNAQILEEFKLLQEQKISEVEQSYRNMYQALSTNTEVAEAFLGANIGFGVNATTPESPSSTVNNNNKVISNNVNMYNNVSNPVMVDYMLNKLNKELGRAW